MERLEEESKPKGPPKPKREKVSKEVLNADQPN